MDRATERVRWIILVLMLTLTGAAFAAPFKGFVEVRPGRKIFVRHLHKSNSHRTIVLINGLTQDMEHWSRVVKELHHHDWNILLYDTFHQGRTLLHWLETDGRKTQLGRRPILPPLLGMDSLWLEKEPMLPEAPISEQAQDLRLLLDHFGIHEPVTLMGLSYGGGLALEFSAQAPHRVDHAILVAPYVAPLPSQDRLIQKLIPMVRPWLSSFSDNEIYEFLLRGLVLSSYHLSEPSIRRWGPYQVYAASELVRGIRPLNASELVQRVDRVPIHVVEAGRDAYLPPELIDSFWQTIPLKNRGTRVVVEGVEHKINESVGSWLARWATLITENGRVPYNERLVASPLHGVVRSGSGPWQEQLPKVQPCEYLLSPKVPGLPALPVDHIWRQPSVEWIKMLRPYLTSEQRAWLDQWLTDWGGF